MQSLSLLSANQSQIARNSWEPSPGFKDKFHNSLSNGQIEALAKCQDLAKLMPQLIKHLEENFHPDNVRATLEFFKGKVEFLPSDFPQSQKPPAATLEILKDLFFQKPNPNLHFGETTSNRISPGKAIENFRALWNAIELFEKLDTWAKDSTFPLPMKYEKKMELLTDEMKNHHQNYGEIPDMKHMQNHVDKISITNLLQIWNDQFIHTDASPDRHKISEAIKENYQANEPLTLSLNGISTLDSFEGAPAISQIADLRISGLKNFDDSNFPTAPLMPNLKRLEITNVVFH